MSYGIFAVVVRAFLLPNSLVKVFACCNVVTIRDHGVEKYSAPFAHENALMRTIIYRVHAASVRINCGTFMGKAAKPMNHTHAI